MKFRPPPPKEHCFEFSAPKEATIDDIIDGFQRTVGPGGLRALQHQGSTRFCAAVASAAAAQKLNSTGEVKILAEMCPITCVGPQVIFMTALRLKLFVSNDDLAAALAPFGRVLSVTDMTFKGHPTVDNGTRHVKMEMAKPVPNFMFVRGCRVQFEYRGVRRVCSRCGQSGHNRGDCQAPWCDRCRAFGHEAESCSAECRKCGAQHPTADCLKPRTYAAALEEFPALPSGSAEQPDVSSEQEFETEPDRTEHDTAEDDQASFTLDDVSSPLSPFGDEDSVTEDNAEKPAPEEARPTTQEQRNTAPPTPLPQRGRGVPSRVSAQAAKLALPGASGSGLPKAPPATNKSPTAPTVPPVSAPPDLQAPAAAPVNENDPPQQDMDLSKDPAKRGPPSSGESDSTKESSKKSRPT